MSEIPKTVDVEIAIVVSERGWWGYSKTDDWSFAEEGAYFDREPASVIVIMAGVYSTYSKWINKEINLAKNGFLFEKPILAVTPWGAERISDVVREASDEVVGWNGSSIVSAIRRLT